MATRWGIAGAGKISHDFVSSIQALPSTDHELVAVAAQDLTRAQGFAKLHGIKKPYGSYKDLANDKNVEVVYIGTLNPSHLEIGKMMINAGKHLLCEKPLTMNLRQTKELIELAKKKNVFLMEAIWSRCFPTYDFLSKEIKSGSIGDVKQVIADFGFQLTDVNRVNQKKLGGGSILDLGVYVIQFACLAFGGERPIGVKASGHLNSEGVDVSMSATFTYKNERTATILTQSLCNVPNQAYVIGTKGMIHVPNFWCPTTVNTPTQTFTIDLPKTKHKLNFVNSSGLSFEAAEVRNCLLKGLKESPKVTHDDSLLIAELEDELRRQIGVVYDVD